MLRCLMASHRAGVDHGLVFLPGFDFHMFGRCRNHGSVETAYAVAEVHILHMEGAHWFFNRFREHLSVNIPGIPPGPFMRI